MEGLLLDGAPECVEEDGAWRKWCGRVHPSEDAVWGTLLGALWRGALECTS